LLLPVSEGHFDIPVISGFRSTLLDPANDYRTHPQNKTEKKLEFVASLSPASR
jgi:hypothetical protein